MSLYHPAPPWTPYETTVCFPAQWDSDIPQPEPQVVSSCDNVLEQRAHRPLTLYLGVEQKSLRDSLSTPSSSQSPTGHSPYRQPLGSATNKDAQSSRKDRRRMQNRAAQRTFRERKEQQFKSLETENADWQAKHHELFEAYSTQSTEVQRLKAEIGDLTSKFVTLRTNLLACLLTEVDPASEFDQPPAEDS